MPLTNLFEMVFAYFVPTGAILPTFPDNRGLDNFDEDLIALRKAGLAAFLNEVGAITNRSDVLSRESYQATK